ncbi:MAG: hypothetical protein Q8N51_09575, partial [Gammaproteobacteria bacterium]|nr:hypothetical protein [Gammaproteobacteria bacterium]
MSRNISAILRSVELAKQQKVNRRGTQALAASLAIDPAELEFWRTANEYKRINADWELNSHPDPIGKHTEPASIYSPVGTSRLSFEKPRKRNGRDPHAV